MTEAAIKKAMKANPTLNGTELAQKLAGGFKGELYPTYVSILHTINKIKRSK